MIAPGRALRAAGNHLGAALALLAFGLAVALLWRRVGIPILSLDDVFRTLFAHEWSRQPFFFTERLVWLPLPLIVTGLAIMVTGEAFWTALAVDLAASAIAITYVYLLAARLFGRLSAWVAATLFALTPWVLFLSLSRYAEPVLLAAAAIGAYHWSRWTATAADRQLALAALALSVAVLSRYEAWPLGAALPVHVAVVEWRRMRVEGGRARWSALWSAAPVLGMAVWVTKNMLVYGRPVYGGAFGFLPDAVRPGAWAGAQLAARYLWDMNPVLVSLAVLGALLRARRAALLLAMAVLAAAVPWWTVSRLPVEVALQNRLMVLPLMMLAPLAGAAVTRIARPRRLAIAAALVVVGAQLVIAARLHYPSPPPPMTALALSLERSGVLARFDAIYVQSAQPRGYPDEVRVGTNFRRPVHVLPLEPASTPWRPETPVLVLNDGRPPPGGRAVVLARVGEMTAWAICAPADEAMDRSRRVHAAPVPCPARDVPPPK